MKKTNILLAVILVCAKCFAQDFSLSVTNSEAFMTEEYPMEISLKNNVEVSSLQCNVILPEGFLLNGAPKLSTRATSSHSISYNVNRVGHLKIVIHSGKSENLIDKDGVLFELPLITTNECPIGENLITFEKVILSSCEGMEYTAEPTTAIILIKDLPIKLDHQSLTMPLQSTQTLNLSFLPEYPYDKTVIWSSSKENVASVTQDGTVTAVGIGSTVITALVANGIHVDCVVNVVRIKAERIELNKNILELIPGIREKLKATVYPENTTTKTLTWTSSNESVAKVSTRGYVEAISLGKATITVTCDEISEQCEVYVTDFIFKSTDLKLKIGDSKYIQLDMHSEGLGAFTWKSSDENIVTVTPSGMYGCTLDAVGIGEAIVTGSNDDYTVTCKVTVTQILVESVSFDQKKITTRVIGYTTTLRAYIFPENAFDKTLVWASSDESVATVTDEGLVTTTGVGSATITATAVYGGAFATCPVEVEPVLVDFVELPKGLGMRVNGHSTLVARVHPSNATDKTLTWTCSDETVVEITSISQISDNSFEAQVFACGPGIATITVTAVGGASNECTVRAEYKYYTITYYVDDSVYYTEQVGEGDPINLIDEPQKEGYTFSGWTLSGGSEPPEIMPGGDLTVRGWFTVNKYIVRYYDGDTLLAEYEVEYHGEIPTYNYDDEDFVGWEGVIYESMPAHDIEFYAIKNNGIMGIQIDEEDLITISNLSGLIVYKGKKTEMPELENGVYIITNGTNSTKMFINN